MNVEKVLAAYLECALLNDEELSFSYNESDFSQKARCLAQKDIEDFLVLAEPYIGKNVTYVQIGYDFWDIRNRHDSGFWDCPKIYGELNAKKLTEIAQKFGEKYVFVQNDLLEFE